MILHFQFILETTRIKRKIQINMHTYANPQVLLLQNMIVSPLQIQYRWHYMQKNGKIYKRLYNETNQEWVGNWIYVRDV